MKEYRVEYQQYKKQLNKADNSQINWEDIITDWIIVDLATQTPWLVEISSLILYYKKHARSAYGVS